MRCSCLFCIWAHVVPRVGWGLHGAEKGFASLMTSGRTSSALGTQENTGEENSSSLPFPSSYQG